jgi:hypothetical protein
VAAHREARTQLSLRRIALPAAAISLAFVYPLLWLQVLSDPRQRTAADFLPFYAAGRIAITEGYASIYDLEALRLAENRILDETIIQYNAAHGQPVSPAELGPPIAASEVNPFSHPPFIVPILGLLARLDYVPAFAIWSLLMGLAAALGSAVLVRLVPQVQGGDRRLLYLTTFLFFPTFLSLINGQDSAVLLVGSAVWAWGLFGAGDRTAGLGLSLAVIRPHMTLILAPAFLLRRRRVWWWFCGGAGLLALISLIMLGLPGVESYIANLLHSADARGYKFVDDSFHLDLTGILRRAIPQMEISVNHAISWIAFLTAIILTAILFARVETIEEKHIGLIVVVTLLFVPHANYHDLVVLLIPLFGLLRITLSKGLLSAQSAAWLLLGVSALMFVTHLMIPSLSYGAVYLIMAFLLIGLWFPEKLFSWTRTARGGRV